MGLIALTEKDIPLGAPLPWMVYDADGRLLMEAGRIVGDAAERAALLAQRPLRELDLPAIAGASAPGEAAVAEGGAAAPKAIAFRDMRLRVGDRLQLEPPPALGPERHIVKLLGYLDGISLMTTVPQVNGIKLQLVEGDMLVMRVFANQNAFAFGSSVMRVCKIPADYLHLEFPTSIQGAAVRKSPRVRTRIIASVSQGDSDDKQPALIANLSADGALLRAKRALCRSGERLRLAFRIDLHGIDALLSLQAVVRSVSAEEGKLGEPPSGEWLHGMQFPSLPANDAMVLQSMIYQIMIEEPQRVV